MSDQFAKEVNNGDTYPMVEPIPFEKFASYWFQNFGAIMLLGKIEKPEDVFDDKDWSKECLGSFYIKPNYPGRSSHVCNAGFLVTDAARNRGVGRLMGEAYLDYAPKLGYTYSVFNLVYETNVASCKIWDALGFKRIGRVKASGHLKSYPGRLIDAIIYGRDLSVDENSEELVSEERFDKIKFYLKYGKYPNGADRAEKSRLRSAATHYKLLDDDKLMLKDKEVISDPQRQYDISRQVHSQHHGGINKTTATIAEKYHWSRIKETVSDVIRACAECKDSSKSIPSLVHGNSVHQKKPPTPTQKQSDATTPPVVPAPAATVSSAPVIPAIANIVSTPVADRPDRDDSGHAHAHAHAHAHLPSFCPAPYSVHHDDMSDLLAVGHHSHVEGAEDDAVDRDLDMILMEQADDDGPDGASARMDVDGLDVDVGVGVGVELPGTGGDHDDLSKMSVGHVLATPEPDDQVGVDVEGGPASGNKDKDDSGVFGIGYPPAG
ncbi:putative zf-h2c2-domain-containing [Diaporthe ampelina]|uniref:Putative zf-h2c2-domain-containing n=1 Tax=Diaporthe ampelina TaxID=1214573 RepID=A0A0G2HMP4_9PEZI|nr:putative zf-h2c2-domain-containing [Diaporthe ampelina]